jgi:predicted GIY-YIG superfamily endonuclease
MKWVYILQCEDDYYYIGETSRLYRRFWEHQDGMGGLNTSMYPPKNIIAIYSVNRIGKFFDYRNEKIKELIGKNNTILYAVPYQHFTNSIENYFSMLKSRLQKEEGLTYEKLKENISNVIRGIPKEKYENIFKGAYNRKTTYVKNKTRKRTPKKYSG